MRPTELNFRSPKEKTPDARHPIVTFDGRNLNFAPSSTKGNFSQSKRFTQYETEAKKTGYRVGPGAYNNAKVELGRGKSVGTPVYKGFHGSKDVTNNGYYLFGNQMVFEPAFVFKSKRIKKDQECGIDSTQFGSRPITANNFYKDSKKSFRTTRPESARSPYMARVRNVNAS